MGEQLRRAHKLLESWDLADQYLFVAKINSVPAKEIRQMLERLGTLIALPTVDTRFHRLRMEMIRHIEES